MFFPEFRYTDDSMSTTIDDRFWEKVDADGDCWVWTAATNTSGYGQFSVGGKHQGAHRVAWELLVGPIPEGLQIDHLCRVKHCVNPDHLEPVSHAENFRRGIRGAQDRAKTHCPQGHPYAGDNLYVHPDGRHRQCRACGAASARRSRARMRA